MRHAAGQGLIRHRIELGTATGRPPAASAECGSRTVANFGLSCTAETARATKFSDAASVE